MTVQANTSSPANGTEAIHTLLTRLLAAGWIVKRWSDATTLSADDVDLTSNPYGSASSGAGNLGNTSAWFRVEAPGGSCEWLFQRGSGDATWTVSRSVAGFTGGSPNATTVGTAADATALFTAATLFSATPGRMFISCDDAAPYGFTMFCITLGGGNVLTMLADEPVIVASAAAEDTDPRVWLGYYNVTGLGVAGFSVANATATVVYKRFPGGTNQRVSFGKVYDDTGYFVAPSASASAQIGPTSVGGKEVPLQIPMFRSGASAATTGWIGYASRLRWGTVYAGRANGQTLSDGSSSYWIFAAGCWVPWDATTPALS